MSVGSINLTVIVIMRAASLSCFTDTASLLVGIVKRPAANSDYLVFAFRLEILNDEIFA